MIVSHEHEFVFIKTRKTAGSTLEKLVYPYLNQERDVLTGSPRDNTPSLNETTGNGHMSWVGITQSYPIPMQNYFRFTIERNPWDKVVSSYFWHQKIKPERFGGMGFEEYIMTSMDLLPIDWGHYANGDVLMINKIYKYEDMSAMYSDLNDRFGFDIRQENWEGTKLKSGIRKVSDYRELHTNATIERVAELFKNEIKLLGYTYE